MLRQFVKAPCSYLIRRPMPSSPPSLGEAEKPVTSTQGQSTSPRGPRGFDYWPEEWTHEEYAKRFPSGEILTVPKWTRAEAAAVSAAADELERAKSARVKAEAELIKAAVGVAEAKAVEAKLLRDFTEKSSFNDDGKSTDSTSKDEGEIWPYEGWVGGMIGYK